MGSRSDSGLLTKLLNILQNAKGDTRGVALQISVT